MPAGGLLVPLSPRKAGRRRRRWWWGWTMCWSTGCCSGRCCGRPAGTTCPAARALVCGQGLPPTVRHAAVQHKPQTVLTFWNASQGHTFGSNQAPAKPRRTSWTGWRQRWTSRWCRRQKLPPSELRIATKPPTQSHPHHCPFRPPPTPFPFLLA